MATINVKLTDGNIVSIEEDSCSYKGCPTCDFGSEYIKELTFAVEVDWSPNKQIVKIKSNTMYEYAEELSTANMIKLLTKVIENPMNFHEFLRTCKETLNINEYDETITLKTYEKVK